MKTARKMFLSSRNTAVISTFGRYVVVNTSSLAKAQKFAIKHRGFERLTESQLWRLAGEIAESESAGAGEQRPMRCGLVEEVEFNNFPVYWDQQLSNCDLMQAAANQSGMDPRKFRAAVIDTGVDASLSKIVPSEITATSNSGAEFHGTGVVSQFLRCSPDSAIRSYPVFRKKGSTYEARDYEVLKAVTDACNSGHLVINLSASNSGEPLQVHYPRLYEDLAERGCILIEASGNSGATTSTYDKSHNPDILTVGASEIDGSVWGHSAPAVIRAPGVLVPILGPEGEKRFSSGTSFAAPRVSAVVKTVYSALAESESFRALSNPRKVKMVAQVVRSSARGGLVDGYRALVLAQGLNVDPHRFEDKDNREPTMKEIFRKASAEMPDFKCAEQKTCQEIKGCYLAKRRNFSLRDSPPPIEEIEDLMASARTSDDTALASHWRRLMQTAEIKH